MFNDLFWAIYWIDVLGSLPGNAFGGVLLAALGSFFVCLFRDFHLEKPRASSALMGFLPVFFTVLLFNFVPSKSTMYMMLGVKTTENVVESPLGKKLQQIIDAEVDGYLKRLNQKKEE
jgi:hypothetical protein